ARRRGSEPVAGTRVARLSESISGAAPPQLRADAPADAAAAAGAVRGRVRRGRDRVLSTVLDGDRLVQGEGGAVPLSADLPAAQPDARQLPRSADADRLSHLLRQQSDSGVGGNAAGTGVRCPRRLQPGALPLSGHRLDRALQPARLYATRGAAGAAALC